MAPVGSIRPKQAVTAEAEIQLDNPLTLFVALGGASLFDGLAAADRITRPNVLLRFIRKPMEYGSGSGIK
jgi:hypothetical protein